jgi:hypothetical protein
MSSYEDSHNLLLQYTFYRMYGLFNKKFALTYSISNRCISTSLWPLLTYEDDLERSEAALIDRYETFS